MKQLRIRLGLLGAALLLSGSLLAQNANQQNNNRPCIDDFEETGPLSAADREILLANLDEENLAMSVYEAMYEKWGSRPFERIIDAEKQHKETLGELLKFYKQPVKDLKSAEFQKAETRALYDKLIAMGSKSALDAFKVGALIEEMDIADLNKALAKTDNPNIKFVLGNLKNGSENHLRAYDRQISRLGGEYVPQHLSKNEYNRIVDGNAGRFDRRFDRRFDDRQPRRGAGRGFNR